MNIHQALASLARRHKFWTFSIVTLAFSWACWLPILSGIQGDLFTSSAGTLGLFFAGAYGPTLSAIALSLYFDGRAGLRQLFERRLPRGTACRWGLLVMVMGPLVYGAALIAFAALGGELGAPNWGLLPWIPVIVLVSLFLGPLAEEIGWRGCALR